MTTTNYGGRPALAARNRRTHGVKIMLRADQHEMLKTFASEWELPVGHVAWGLLSDLLAQLSDESQDSQTPLAIVASRYLLKRGA